MTKVNDAVTELFLHKGSLIKNSSKYRVYLKGLLDELNINDNVDACVLGAIDAMIYDIACSLDFTKQKGKINDWSSYRERKKVIRKLWGGI